MHQLAVFQRRHAVVRAPEDVGGEFYFLQEGTEVFFHDLDHRLLHEGAGLLVVVDADELVEELPAERREAANQRNGTEDLAGFAQRQSKNPAPMAGMADAGCRA